MGGEQRQRKNVLFMVTKVVSWLTISRRLGISWSGTAKAPL